MNRADIINNLINSGLTNIGMDNNYVYFDDPSCIFPAFETLLNYAWIVILVLTAFMLLGWAVLYIKNGVKINSVFNNAKSLILIFCVLSLVKPIVNFVYGDNLLSRQCEQKKVSLATVQELYETRKKIFGETGQEMLYETFDVIDSGVIFGEESASTTSVENYANAKPMVYQESNVGFSTYALTHGATVESDNRVVFKNTENGIKTFQNMLESEGYSDKTIEDLIDETSAKNIEDASGVSSSRIFSSLNEQEKEKVARAVVNYLSKQPQQQQLETQQNPVNFRQNLMKSYVLFTNKFGETIKRTGGSSAWRTNNPGNIIFSKFALQHGAVGKSGKFAVFPDEKTGQNAVTSLLLSDGYKNLSISAAIHKWAPAADNNDPKKYTNTVAKSTGLSPNKKIKDLSDKELQSVANAIRKVEGWIPGKEQKL